ncbi:MAG: hypothetical protein AAGE52_30230 [Myxococcota bacterium]
MATSSLLLVTALRRTAQRLREGAAYRWSHYAMCNCGNLAQVITELSPQEIYEAAFSRPGDWGEQARDYCPTSGLPMDEILRQMLDVGLEVEDLRHLERLTHPKVLQRIPAERKPLRHTDRDDTILFLETWAALLEERLPSIERLDEGERQAA